MNILSYSRYYINQFINYLAEIQKENDQSIVSMITRKCKTLLRLQDKNVLCFTVQQTIGFIAQNKYLTKANTVLKTRSLSTQ
jgi:hypothetical protein